MTRLFYAKWKDSGLTPKDVVDFVQKNITIEWNKIDDIWVFWEFTFMNLPTDKAEELIDKAWNEDWRNVLVKAKKREPREWWFWGWRSWDRDWWRSGWFRWRGWDRWGDRGFWWDRRWGDRNW
jgi:hypothetical protein